MCLVAESEFASVSCDVEVFFSLGSCKTVLRLFRMCVTRFGRIGVSLKSS